jgi:hypothetical protein
VPSCKKPQLHDEKRNLAPAHKLCNNLKGDMSEDEWLAELAAAGGSVQKLIEIRQEKRRLRPVMLVRTETHIAYNG